VQNLKNLPRAWFNLVPYRELGLMTAKYLEEEFGMPYVDIAPMGVVETARCIRKIQGLINGMGAEVDYDGYINNQTLYVSQAAWFSRSIDCQNLTGKKAVVFGDNTHAAAMTKILAREMGIHVVWAGTYCKHDADWFRQEVSEYCDEVIITDDHGAIGDAIARVEPSAIFGTQMERHVGKRLDIPCGVIAAPIHIQNFPIGYKPFMGYEGTNQITDLVYNSFTLGMEDHLLEIFGGHDTKEVITKGISADSDMGWTKEGQAELNKIPGFVRGKVKRNTEKFARDRGIDQITVEVLYAAKESVGA
jgi:light-independent protochlorophyllide reductase subunit B